MIPVIEVSHLPSSASFYAAVSQPLGIHFISHTSTSYSFDFGLPASSSAPCQIFFTLCESPNPKLSLLEFRASALDVVTDFHRCALLALPSNILSANSIKHTAGESIARITDLDGNMLEARFTRRSSAPLITTASTKEARRVLDWQREVALSLSDDSITSSPISSRRRHSYSSRDRGKEQEPHLLRRETITASHYRPRERDAQGQTEDRIISSMSNQALIGTILGAAAGAAMAYAMVKSEEPRSRELSRPRMASYHSSPAVPRLHEIERTIEAASARSDSHAGSGHPVRRRDWPQHVASYIIANAKGELGQIDEDKSVSHRTQEPEVLQVRESDSGGRKGGSERSKSSRRRTQSQKDRDGDQPLTIVAGSGSPRSATSRHSEKADRDGQSKSKSGSRSGSRSGSKSGAKSQSSHTSARASPPSEASTVKPKAKPRSRVTTTITLSNPEAVDRDPQRGSQRGSVVSARNIPIPESTFISVYSVGPSDSISSAGMKKERERERERERRRM